MKFLNLNKSYTYILATLLCLVFVGASYFFIYLPKNERIIEEQRFRTLQNIDNNIHEKIDNSLSLIKTVLKLYGTNSQQYLEKYIGQYTKDKFILSLIKTKADTLLKDSIENAPTIVVNDATKEITLLSKKQLVPSLNNTAIQGGIKYSFKQFIEYLLPGAVFDEYIIFSKNNTVYESFPSGISNPKEDSLINNKNGIGGSYVKSITVGGKDYKLFLHSVSFDSKNKWILGGLLLNTRYQQERAELPAGIIMLLVTAVLTMIVIFPWIKLYQMGSKDRLTFLDGASSVLVSMLLMSLLFFCFFKYNVSIRGSDSPNSKKVLASKISSAFYNEISSIYFKLKACDSLRANSNKIKNIINLDNPAKVLFADTSLKKSAKNVKVDTTTKAFLKGLNLIKVDQIFWLDSNGVEKYNWISDSLNPPPGNFKARNYFKNIIENKPYFLDGNPANKYYLDQVVSWNSGTFTSIVSIPSVDTNNYVSAISFTMRSLQDAVLPTGYTFAVVDNNGKVLYHSLSSRNLNENLKIEFFDSANISSCIDSRSEGEFKTRYYSKNYSVSINPIKNLPYFIVIFSDTSYKNTRDIEIYSFTFSMLFLIFLYIVLQLCLIMLVSSRRSFFRKQLFDTSWIGPKISCHKAYVLSAALNILVIILLIAFFQKTSFLLYLFLLLFSITFISLFLNILFAKRYKDEGKKNNFKYKIKAVRWLTFVLVVINIVASNLLEHINFLTLLFLEIGAIIKGWLFIFYTNNITQKLPVKIKVILSAERNYIKSFALMSLTGLIITSGIPVAFFYITSYNYEQNLSIRQRQTNYASRILNGREFKLANDYSQQTTIQNTTGIYYDSSWITSFPYVIDNDGIYKKFDTVENTPTRKLMANFHLTIGDNFIKTDNLYIPYSADTSVIYHPLLINTNGDSNVSTFMQTPNKGKYLKVTSFNLDYSLPGFFKSKSAFLYWTLMIFALVVFYFIIINILKKIFCLNLPDLKVWKQLDDKLITDNKLNRLLFVIGLPGAGKKNYILDMIKHGQIKYKDELLIYDPEDLTNNNVFIADLINMPDTGANIEKDEGWKKFCQKAIHEKNKLVIINHFEYNIQDEYTNIAKLNFLEQLMLKNKSKIIILSTIHPISFLDSLNEVKRKVMEDNKKPETSDKPSHDFERWNVLLGHYRIAIIAIKKNNVNPLVPAWKQLISRETDYTHFLHDMQGVTFDIAKSYLNEKEESIVSKTDELAYKLQVSAHYFYMYIWQSLTKEEKFLLYDLAEDNLVNSYDNHNLTMLIAKGVIIHSNGSLQFFNKGFRNFILTAIGNTEAMKIKDRIKENGNWSKLKTPLVIVILAILSFLFISQQEAYTKLLTYVAALTAGVPAVLKIFSLFDKNATKANT